MLPKANKSVWSPAATSTGNLDSRRIRSTVVPAEYRGHPLVQGRIFFTLPRQLLANLAAELGNEGFDPNVQELELELSQICDDHTQRVGFRSDAPIVYGYLRRSPLTAVRHDENTLQELGWDMTLAEVNSSLKLAESRSRKYFQVSQGYAGWLMTNPTFVDEHDNLL